MGGGGDGSSRYLGRVGVGAAMGPVMYGPPEFGEGGAAPPA